MKLHNYGKFFKNLAFTLCLLTLFGYTKIQGSSARSLSHVVKAYANPGLNCGGAGTGCTVTFNGSQVTVSGHKVPDAL